MRCLILYWKFQQATHMIGKGFITFLGLLLVSNVSGYTKTNCICGVENPSYLTSRPIGARFSWMVALSTARGETFCSGALVSDRHVLTAGTCIIYE